MYVRYKHSYNYVNYMAHFCNAFVIFKNWEKKRRKTQIVIMSKSSPLNKLP